MDKISLGKRRSTGKILKIKKILKEEEEEEKKKMKKKI